MMDFFIANNHVEKPKEEEPEPEPETTGFHDLPMEVSKGIRKLRRRMLYSSLYF